MAFAAVPALALLLSACRVDPAGQDAEAAFPSGCASGQLGCVTGHNLAATAARPSDLAGPRREQPRDSIRRDAIIAAYRQSGTKAQAAGADATAITLQEGKSR